MDNLPLISIALCTYNGAKFLEEQINSLVSQTYSNLEIVIVDDCSIDNTVNILRYYELEYDYISVYTNNSNIGVNESFSKAISLCKGKFIAISDQDDIWLPNKIKDAYDYMGDNMMVYSNSLLIDEKGNNLNRRKFKKKELYSGNDPRSLSISNTIAGHTMMFRTELIEYILPIPPSCHYDWWISFVGANLGNIAFLPVPYAMHRIHSNNVSKKFDLIQQDRYEAMKRWTSTMLSVRNLKYFSFFEELDSTLETKSNLIKKMKLIIFQVKYRNIIFLNKGFFSKINRARKLRFPYIP